MRYLNEIIVHCAATRPNMDIGVAEIRHWHVHGNKWRDIGYHFVIRRDGTIEDGRPIEVSGAHTGGRNSNSIGVCLVGGVSQDDYTVPENNFTDAQFDALEHLLRQLKADYGIEQVSGHRDYAAKACPSFDVHEFVAERGI